MSPDAGRRNTRAAALHREQGLSSHVFMTERDGPMTPKAFHALFGRIGERAKMPFPVHPQGSRTSGDRRFVTRAAALHREQGLSSHVFMTERDGPMTPKAFHALFGRIGERAKMPFPVHPQGSRTSGDRRFVAIGVTSSVSTGALICLGQPRTRSSVPPVAERRADASREGPGAQGELSLCGPPLPATELLEQLAALCVYLARACSLAGDIARQPWLVLSGIAKGEVAG